MILTIALLYSRSIMSDLLYESFSKRVQQKGNWACRQREKGRSRLWQLERHSRGHKTATYRKLSEFNFHRVMTMILHNHGANQGFFSGFFLNNITAIILLLEHGVQPRIKYFDQFWCTPSKSYTSAFPFLHWSVRVISPFANYILTVTHYRHVCVGPPLPNYDLTCSAEGWRQEESKQTLTARASPQGCRALYNVTMGFHIIYSSDLLLRLMFCHISVLTGLNTQLKSPPNEPH